MIIKEILLFAVSSFSVILLLNLLGKFLSPVFVGFTKDRPVYNFFLESIVGLIAVVTAYSCFFSRFLTINCGFIILFALLFVFNNKNRNYYINFKDRFYSANLRWFFLLFLLCLIISVLNIIYPNPESVASDIFYYVRIAEDIADSGQENIFSEYNSVAREFNGTFPYHYLEFWFGSMLFHFFGSFFTNIIIFKYICYAVLKVLALCGMLSVIENFKDKITFIDVVIVASLSLFNFLYLTEAGDNDWILYHDMWLRPNMIIYIIFLSLFFSSLSLKNYGNSVVFLLFLPIASTVTAPAIFFGLTLFVILLAYRKRITQKETVFLLISIISIAVFILGFYRITSVDYSVFPTDNRSISDMLRYSISIYKAIIYFLITLSFRTLLLLLFPAVCVFLLLKNWKYFFLLNAGLWVSSLLIVMPGIMIFQILPFVDNTYQFPYVGYAACYLVALIVFFQLISGVLEFSRNKTVSFVFIVLFYAFNFIHIKRGINLDIRADSMAQLEFRHAGLDVDFPVKTKKYFSGSAKLNGGFIFDEKDIGNIPPGNRQTLTSQLGSYLAYLKSDIFLVSLTSPEVLYDSEFKSGKNYKKVYGFNKMTPFYKNYHSGSYSADVQNYIKDNDIGFLMISKNFDFKTLGNIPVRDVVSDNATGTKLIVL